MERVIKLAWPRERGFRRSRKAPATSTTQGTPNPTSLSGLQKPWRAISSLSLCVETASGPVLAGLAGSTFVAVVDAA